MPQFDAEAICEPLRVKLTPFADFDGIVEEPSDKQIGAFLAELKGIFRQAQESTGMKEQIEAGNADQITAAFENLDPEQFVRAMSDMADAHAALCSHKPSKAMLLKVPLRRRLLFFAWLENEVVNPEAAPGAGNGQVRNLPLPAAG